MTAAAVVAASATLAAASVSFTVDAPPEPDPLAERFERVAVGMTQTEVRQLVRWPDTVVRLPGGECWEYRALRVLQVCLERGRVTRVSASLHRAHPSPRGR